MPCAFLRYHHFQFWLGSQFATWASIWASEAPQRPQRPQRPLRRPSEAPLGSQFGPQRLGSQFGLGIGIIKMPSVAERQRCLIKLPLPWRDCGGPNIFLPPQCGGPCQLKKFSSAKSGGRNGCLPPSITPFPPQKRSLFSPINKKPSYWRYTATNRHPGWGAAHPGER